MKGFYIEITNNLLEPKHYKIMKESVWLYMWMIDKMTSVSEEGVGKILGGKPIIYEEVNKELGITRRVYTDWVRKLRRGKYINTLRTPTGLVMTVNKAKKRFHQKPNSDVPKATHHSNSDVPKATEGCTKSAEGCTKFTHPIRQDKDKTKTRQYNTAKFENFADTENFSHKQIIEIFDVFKKINPMINYGHKTQRQAVVDFIGKFGFEKTKQFAAAAIAIQGRDFAPTITNPYLLKIKLGELKIYYQKQNSNSRTLKL